MGEGTTRRAVALGLGGVSIVAAGGLVWRAHDAGVLGAADSPAYQPWADWRDEPLHGPLAIVRAGILAANAHNTQPWRFEVREDHFALHADPARHLGAFDPFRREMHLSLGCALENMAIAAQAAGHDAEIHPESGDLPPGGPDTSLAAVMTLTPGEAREQPLLNAIAQRHTHRGSYLPVPAPQDAQQAMRAMAEAEGMRLVLYEDGPEKGRLGELVVSATETIIHDAEMAQASAAWFRFTRRAVEEHRDGITLDAAGLPPLILAAAKMLPSPGAEAADRQWLEATRAVHVGTAPLLGMICVDGLYDRAATLTAERLWQRLHLWMTTQGMAAQPLNQPVEIVDREAELGREPAMAAALAQLTGDTEMRPTFVFRAGYALRPARPSPRRPAAAVIA